MLVKMVCSKESDDISRQIKAFLLWGEKPGVFTSVHLFAGGFEYTGDGDTARCKDCRLEISNWTLDMDPFTIHLKQKPDCSFVRSIIASPSLNALCSTSWSTTAIGNTSISTQQQNSSQRQRVETIDSEQLSNTFREVDVLQQIRPRTFSHWPHDTILSSMQMIDAGFFYCNMGDRVICIYCNLICQQWTPHTDDPCEVHKTLSPNCIYVKAKLMCGDAIPATIDDESSGRDTTANHSSTTNNLDRWPHVLVRPAVCNPTYAELLKRDASFATWPQNNLPPVDDLVRAGFFYTGTNTIVTCFYCNGSLQNWGPNDNPMREHARWFPHCAYAKQLCGDEMYRKIQESERTQQENITANELGETAECDIKFNTYLTTGSRHLVIPDENTLSLFVDARLHLPVSQRLLDVKFELFIIKRCWEDQLRLKQNDFVHECDLFVACSILQKQIRHIDGKKENIVIPSIKMKQVRKQNATRLREQTLTTPDTTQSVSNTTNLDMATSSASVNDQINQMIQYYSNPASSV